MTPVRLEPGAPLSRVKRSTTEPLCSLFSMIYTTSESLEAINVFVFSIFAFISSLKFHAKLSRKKLYNLGASVHTRTLQGPLRDFPCLHSFLASGDFCRLPIAFANCLDPDQDYRTLLRYRMAGITESAMVAYTHKYAVV